MALMAARYEYKYLIDEHQADVVREMTSMYMDPDPFALAGDDGHRGFHAYDVYSVYLDSWDWMLARQTIAGIRERYKLRVRTYAFDGKAPIFLENKMRVGTSIIKDRALVGWDDVEALLRGDPPPEHGFVSPKPNHQKSLVQFRDLMDTIDARPRIWVGYEREPWVSPWGEGSRLTFDRDLRVQVPDLDAVFLPDPSNWLQVALKRPIVLEMKFNGAFPHWMQHVVNALHLRRISCSKYVHGADICATTPWAHEEWRTEWTPY